MDNDDLLIGRILTRREILSLIGLTGAAVLAACASDDPAPGSSATATGVPPSPVPTDAVLESTEATAPAAGPVAEATQAVLEATAAPACVVRPELTEGPFFFDLGLDRSDIRTDSATGAEEAGLRLDLAVVVSGIDGNGCLPLEGAVVDLWQCDAEGNYSGTGAFADQSFLRGLQRTDASGRAAFTTIYPGWYPGRAVHIHFKIRYPEGPNGTYEFTSQFFFDDDFSAQVFQEPAYAARGTQNTLNAQDGIFGSGGSQLVLNPVAAGDGLAAEFHITLDLTNADAGAED